MPSQDALIPNTLETRRSDKPFLTVRLTEFFAGELGIHL
jgi:hypothetical protein